MLTNWIDSLFPVRCLQCHQTLRNQEPGLCTTCLDSLAGWPTAFNTQALADEIFGGRVPIQSVYLLATFHTHSPLRSALHSIKYHGNKELARVLGSQLFHHHPFSSNIDIAVPVPIHPEKRLKRGYNQAEIIAKGICEESGIRLENALIKIANTQSQTLLSREDRWENASKSYELSENQIAEKDILLVDDTLTTGATLEACALPLLEGGAKSISVAVLGYASV